MCGSVVSVTGARCWATEENKAGPGYWAETEGERNSLSFFSFPNFQSNFLKDFESSFEFDSNHSIQKFRCSSMNAQSCFYPYILF
jgi:hypothetical protein